MLPMEAMLMSVMVVMVVVVLMVVSGDVCGSCILCLKTMLMPMVPNASTDHVSVCGLCYCMRPGLCSWSILLLEDKWMSVAQACRQTPC